jgi:hypothetical protein
MPNIFAQPYYTGTPLGTLAFYGTGTLVLAAIYSDSAGVTPLPNPITADTNGRYPEIYLADGVTYRVIERDSGGVTLADVDPINPTGALSSLSVAGNGTFTGYVRAATPNSGTAGGCQLLGNVTTGFAYAQVLNNTAAVEWGNWRYDSTGLARWSGAAQVVGALTVGGALSAGAGVFSDRAYTVPTALTVAATTTLDASGSNAFTATLATNITTFTINNAVEGQTLSVLFKQDGTGSRTIAWPASFRWPAGSAPVLSTAAGSRDLLTAQFIDGVWLAALSKGFA